MGIGAAIAEQLARDGMTVLVSDMNLEEAEKTAGRFRDEGLSAQALQLNVGQLASVDAAFDQIAKTYGRCDVMVNNAGIAKTFPFIDFPLDNCYDERKFLPGRCFAASAPRG